MVQPKLFSDLYLAKFLDIFNKTILQKHFFYARLFNHY